MATFYGTLGWDVINGTDEDDLILGYPNGTEPAAEGGFDNLYGFAGNDTIEGGGGEDGLRGGAGNDLLIGGPGSDSLVDDDWLGVAGNDTMLGGAGDDFLASYGGTDVIDGGDDEAPGTDQLSLFRRNETASIVIDLNQESSVLPDGTTFTGIESLSLFSGSGDDVITLKPGTVVGTVVVEGTNVVYGGAGDDWIWSADGSYGGIYDGYVDQLYGEDGNDTLIGGWTMEGGEGNDTMVASDLVWDEEPFRGSELSGGPGDDHLTGGRQADTLRGGDGNDTIQAVSGDVIDGGDGADRLIGGDGADFFLATTTGDFRVTTTDGHVDILTGGLGSDEYQIGVWQSGRPADVITDFAPGAGGDVLTVRDLLAANTAPDWYVNPYDPWAAGYLRLKQDGSDTLLQADLDGSAGASGWETVLVLENLTAIGVTFENFHGWPGWPHPREPDEFYEQQYQPVYAPPPITGTLFNDVIEGTNGDDLILGHPIGTDPALGGFDELSGLGGNDTIEGGGGFDTLRGGAGDDLLVGGLDGDLIIDDDPDGIAGNDTLLGGTGGNSFVSYGGVDVIDGGDDEEPDWPFDFPDNLELHRESETAAIVIDLNQESVALPDGTTITGIENVTLHSGSGDDVITLKAGTLGGYAAGEGDNVVYGGAGDDWIWSADGSYDEDFGYYLDRLYGGEGNDTLIGAQYMDGGGGNDTLIASDVVSGYDDEGTFGSNLLGGAGDDHLTGGKYTDWLEGGDGNDVIHAVSSQEGIPDFYYERMDGGDGADTLVGSDGLDIFLANATDDHVDILTGGLATDVYQIGVWQSGRPADVITDFATGAGGDILTVRDLLTANTAPDWYEDPYDPWAAGYLRLKQDGPDTLFQTDLDGSADASGWETVLVLENVTAIDVTFENVRSWPDWPDPYEPDEFYLQQYQPVYVPDDGPPPITGTPGRDRIKGTEGDDVIAGLDGNDRLRGRAGHDSIDGGAGRDRLHGGDGNDVLEGGAGHDRLSGGDGNDVIDGGSGNDWLFGGDYVDTFVFAAGFGDDVLKDYRDGDTLSFSDALLSGGAAAVDTVADLKALVDGDNAVSATLHNCDVVIAFSSGESLTLAKLADDWLVT